MSLSSTKPHHEDIRQSGDTLHAFLTSKLAPLPRKKHQLNRKIVRLQRKSGCFGAERILLTLTGIELTFLGRPDCSPIIIPTKLSTCFHYFLLILGVQVKGKLLSLCIGEKEVEYPITVQVFTAS